MKLKTKPDLLLKWGLYTPQQQERILTEFRKKLPHDYYCKTSLIEFLHEKITKEDEKKICFSSTLNTEEKPWKHKSSLEASRTSAVWSQANGGISNHERQINPGRV